MNSYRRSLVCMIVAATLLPAVAAQAVVRYVALDGSGTNGQSWATAYTTIQAAINDSAMTAGGEIRVKQGVYELTGPIVVSKAVGIYGGYSGEGDTRAWETYRTTIDGMEEVYHCLWVSANATIDGFGIMYGIAAGFADDNDLLGGGMAIINCAATVSNCVFKYNYAEDSGGAIATYLASGTKIIKCTFTQNTSNYLGGAIYNEDSTGLQVTDCVFAGNASNDSAAAISNVRSGVTITGCVFEGNVAAVVDEGVAGAILNEDSPAVIRNCIFKANKAPRGAGVFNYFSDAVIESCWFSECDSATISGGGVYNYAGSPTIKDCLFDENAVRDVGGGIADYGSGAKTINCVLWKNSAVYGGGGIYIGGTLEMGTVNNPQFINCTIYGNTTTSQGGGVCSEAAPSSFVNCIVWGNAASKGFPGIVAAVEASAIKPTVRYSDIEGTGLYSGTGNKNADPKFMDPDDSNFTLSFDSPCLDAGNNAAVIGILTDYEGKTRVVDGDGNGTALVDMGAVELQGPQDHLTRGQIMWSIAYDHPSDTTPVHTFMLRLETDNTLTSVDFQPPGGKWYTIPGDAQTSSGNVETYHRAFGATHVWEYWAKADNASALDVYGSGAYRILAHYRNSSQSETQISCFVPGTTTPVPQPTQKPQVNSPVYGAKAASPVRLSWNACTDGAANSVYLTIVDSETDEEVINDVLAKTVTQSGEYRLGGSTYEAEIGFGNLYEVAGSDGTPFQYGRTVLVGHRFTVPYTAVFRFWSPTYIRHFYTIGTGERDKLIQDSANWIFEGTAFYACSTKATDDLLPVYRLWSGKGHIYTISEEEKDSLVTQAWTLEGIAFYAYPEGSEPSGSSAVYRFLNIANNARFYTIKEAEANKIITQYSHAFSYEGVAFYAYRP